MDPRTLASDYDDVKVDAVPMSNPESQVAAATWNKATCDLAQLTNTKYSAVVKFTTTVAAAVATIAAGGVSIRSLQGNAAPQKPVITKTATGEYTLTFAATQNNELGVAEALSFFAGHCSCTHATKADKLKADIQSIAANVVKVITKANSVLADVGDSSAAVFEVVVFLV